METQAGLAFAWQLLDKNQRLQIREIWSKQPQGRYLLPFEIARHLRIGLKKTLTMDQENSMHKTWIEWCQKHDAAQDSLPSEHDLWFSWLDFAAENYLEPLAAV